MLNEPTHTLILLVMLAAEFNVGAVSNECQIFREERDRFDECRGMALRTIDSVIEV